MLGRTNASAGGAIGGLDFVMIGSTTPPENAVQNTVWVNTDTEVTSWVLSAEEPESPAAGMVWAKIDTTSNVPVAAPVGGDWFILNISSVKQHIGGEWIGKGAKTYQNGEWIVSASADLRTYLFNNGVINTELTGGIYYPALSDDSIHFEKNSISGGTTYTYSTKEKVNLTDYSVVKARCISGNTIESAIFRICVIDKTANGTHFTTSQMVASISEYGPFNGIERIAELDISELTGEYYLGYAFGVRSSATAGNVNNDVYEWWLE
jgi:hypothetical protein